jgi:hypothetical protein
MLTCIAASTGGRPDYYEWYRDMTILPYSGTMGETYKTTVTMFDAERYKCIAFNAGGQAESSMLTLSVQSMFPPGLLFTAMTIPVLSLYIDDPPRCMQIRLEMCKIIHPFSEAKMFASSRRLQVI